MDIVLAPDFSAKYCNDIVFSLSSLDKKSIIPHISLSVGGLLNLDFKYRKTNFNLSYIIFGISILFPIR